MQVSSDGTCSAEITTAFVKGMARGNDLVTILPYLGSHQLATLKSSRPWRWMNWERCIAKKNFSAQSAKMPRGSSWVSDGMDYGKKRSHGKGPTLPITCHWSATMHFELNRRALLVHMCALASLFGCRTKILQKEIRSGRLGTPTVFETVVISLAFEHVGLNTSLTAGSTPQALTALPIKNSWIDVLSSCMPSQIASMNITPCLYYEVVQCQENGAWRSCLVDPCEVKGRIDCLATTDLDRELYVTVAVVTIVIVRTLVARLACRTSSSIFPVHDRQQLRAMVVGLCQGVNECSGAVKKKLGGRDQIIDHRDRFRLRCTVTARERFSRNAKLLSEAYHVHYVLFFLLLARHGVVRIVLPISMAVLIFPETFISLIVGLPVLIWPTICTSGECSYSLLFSSLCYVYIARCTSLVSNFRYSQPFVHRGLAHDVCALFHLKTKVTPSLCEAERTSDALLSSFAYEMRSRRGVADSKTWCERVDFMQRLGTREMSLRILH
ncbi:uncharacterized protein MYCFIDRAFT_176856 [Pseudocercospora fijiensis CIRAD86]|uniref:Uncharacterized protein n=1 Tax=Pseudocercospora fijiensis (strain CIRAD86) TaxID=383855 RepID=M2YQ60_PSEFD|nr:uncharacterized protein MYCFIDRAFT_176856 [Pseudocercospora fijiensis CIRAD86]EME79850.1 hypothetical protein MYCFIDRAFT_176856 [Pseudocercospora fijiensis CIRAD86]